jgi:hypothetical protein
MRPVIGFPIVKTAPLSVGAENDLAGAMVAQTDRAFLTIAQGNAPKEPTVKILEYKDMGLRARATSVEQQQLAERAKHHKKSVKVEMMRRNCPTQQNFTRSQPCVYFWFRARVM